MHDEVAMTTPTDAPHAVINLRDIIAAPSVALRRVSAVQTRRDWWFPALLALLTSLLHLGLTLDLQIANAREAAAQQLSLMPPEQAEAARAMMDAMLQPKTMFLTSAASLLFALLMAWLFAMLILYFGIALLGQPVKVNALWAAVAWTWIPLALRPLVQLAWTLATGSLLQYQGLSYFVATGDPLADGKNPLVLALAQVDLFNLWHLALIYILLRTVGKRGRGGSLAILAVYILVLGGAHVIPALITRLIGF